VRLNGLKGILAKPAQDRPCRHPLTRRRKTRGRQIVSLVISVLAELGGRWGVLIADDGQSVLPPVPSAESQFDRGRLSATLTALVVMAASSERLPWAG